MKCVFKQDLKEETELACLISFIRVLWEVSTFPKTKISANIARMLQTANRNQTTILHIAPLMALVGKSVNAQSGFTDWQLSFLLEIKQLRSGHKGSALHVRSELNGLLC